MLLSISTHAQSSKPLTEQCRNYLEARDYQRAISAGEQAIRLCPNSYDDRICFGKAYRKVRNLPKALEVFQQSVRLARKKEELGLSYDGLGSVYESMGNFDNALYYYQRSLEIAKGLGNRKAKVQGG